MGKPQPEKEPDYTAERAAFSTSSYNDRMRQADDYNNSVAGYNSKLNDYLGQYQGLASQVGNLSIRDADKFAGFSNNIADLQRQVTGSSFTTAKPFFESMVQSPYGAVQVGAPSLANINSNAQDQLTSGLTGLSSSIAKLQQERAAEEKRIGDFRTSILGQLGSIGSTLNTASIANKGTLDSLASQLDSLNTQRSTFSSDILDQLYPGGLTQVGSQYDLARASLDDLYARRNTEQTRVNDFQSGLRSSYDNFLQQFGGLNIANEGGMNSLKQAIDAAQLGASRFSSELGYNFTGDLNQIQGLEDQLDGMMRNRTSELARIDAAKLAGRNAANSLEAQLANANIYNLAGLNSMKSAIDQGQSDLEGFTSDLSFDFGDTGARLQSAEDAIGQLMAQRQQRLGGYQSDLSTMLAALNGTDLWNEAGIKKAMTDLQGLQSNASRFSGSDTFDLGFGIEDALRRGQGRLAELADYRTGIETRAKSALDAATGQSFYGMDDFNAPQATLDALLAEMDKYGATQASDELAGLKSRLTSERSRLAQDLQNQQQNAGLGQSDVAKMLAANGNGPMSVQQYLAFLAQLEDDEFNPANAGGFSQNLGVIRL